MKKFLWVTLLFLAACASVGPPGDTSYPSAYNFTVTLPEQWRKLDTRRYLMMTREGPFSQYILVQQRHVNQPFRHTKKMIRKDMLPQEAAQVVLDEILSDRAVLNFQVLENLPATVNGYDGFRILFTYRTSDGLRFKTLYYGLLQGDWFYSLRYNAAEARFSEADVETFRKVLDSFQINASHPA